MQSKDIRQSFIDFFRDRAHREVASGPLVPHGDPTLLFTNAGMVQFKDFFLGLETPPEPRAVSVQKCLRVSGKHNDLENVGPSPRHHTFFEMLGNFSFGDYFKEDAIRFGWELVTAVWGVPQDRLYATVFEEDDDAAGLWARLTPLPAERILRCGAADNFWAMGDTGPCGPCSEIFVDMTPDQPQVPFEEGSESGRYLEIWNLVFMEFERHPDGSTTRLPNPSIDTGAGLERVSATLQGVFSNYDTDLFQPLIRAAASLASVRYGASPETDISLRVIADHLRAVSFLLADGVIPGPDGRGYVLRRLLRRAVRHGMRLGFEEPFLHRLVPELDEVMGGHYQELSATRDATVATVREEEDKYLATRAAGARRIQEEIDRARRDGSAALSGDQLFRLYDTYGQELEAIREIAEEEQLELDVASFEERLESRRSTSRQATGKLQKRLASLREALAAEGAETETAFEGYTQTRWQGAEVLRLATVTDDGAAAAQAIPAGATGVAVLDHTVFYAEGGGQVGDSGDITWPGGRARVTDTQKDNAGTYFHFLQVEEGELQTGGQVTLQVDADRRLAIERHHTATHLLHAALRQVLGEGVRQAGSLVAPDRLRFDFTHGQPVSDDDLRAIEDLVNRWVLNATGMQIQLRDYREALEAGAMALFGEKYGDQVRTVEVPGFSLELCGGCHVRNTGEIGPLLVTAERGVASGIRRVEAITGEVARQRIRQREQQLASVAARLGAVPERAEEAAEGLRLRLKDLEQELAQLRRQLVAGGAEQGGEQEVDGIKLVAREVPDAPSGELRNLADTLRDKLGSGVVVLAARSDGKVSLVVTASKDLAGRVHAGHLARELAGMVGGRGGGRPDFAQAGGKEPEALPGMLDAVPGVLGRLVENP